MNTIKKSFYQTLILLLGSTYYYATAQKLPDAKPYKHVIFIVADDHTANVIGAYGNKVVRTPNLDKMASEGILFEQAYTSSPLCSPSRQSILTGKYPHATGVSVLRSSFPESQVTIADYLTPQGFKTAIIGKNHFNNTLNHGFEVKIERQDYEKYIVENPIRKLNDSVKVRPQWKPFKDPASIWLNSEGLPSAAHDQDQPGTYYAKKAIDFINQNKDDQFLLWIGFEEPHSPFNFPVEFANKYDPESLKLPAGSKEDDRWIPEIFKNLTDKEKKGIIASYYSSVEFLDKNVGLILDAVEKAGLSESTLIVYLGDNGYQLNDHKRFEKHTMWQPSVRVPLIIKAGNKLNKGRRIAGLTEFVDLVPTAIDALGLKPLPTAQGKSILADIKGQNTGSKDYVFSEYLEDNTAMVRTARWKYIFATGQQDLGLGYATGYPAPGVTHFLYDQLADPNEAHNRANEKSKARIISDLQQKMLRTFERTHPLGKLPNTLSVVEKLTRYTQPPELAVK